MQKPLSSLALRLISSAVLIPAVIGIIIWGGWAFATLIALCIAIALAEWINISKHIPTSPIVKAILISAGLVYLGISYMEMIYLRTHDYGSPFWQDRGIFWTIVYMLLIWGSDSGAYLFGKTIGGPKMSPTISPNKTWSGYCGALLFPAIILTLCIYILPPFNINTHNSWLSLSLFTGVLIGIAGQAGDLMISFLKRKAGLKDTGALIPGHGGILDRIDALLLALPVYLAYVKYAAE